MQERQDSIVTFFLVIRYFSVMSLLFDEARSQTATTLIPPENLLELLTINSAIHAAKQSWTTTTEVPSTTARPGVLSGVPIPTLWPVLPESPSQAKDTNKKQHAQTTASSSLLGYQPYAQDYAMYHNNIFTGLTPLRVQPFRYFVANSGPARGTQLFDDAIQQQPGALGQAMTVYANGQRQELLTYAPYQNTLGSLQQTQPSLQQYQLSPVYNNLQPGSVSVNEVSQGTAYFLPQLSGQNPTGDARFPQFSAGPGGQQIQQVEVNNQALSGLAQTLSQANIYNLMPSETYFNQQVTNVNSVSNSRWSGNPGPVPNAEHSQYGNSATQPVYEEGKSGIYGYGAQPGYAALPYNFYGSKEISNNIMNNQLEPSNLPYPGCHK